jgi:hypothetical protein
MTLHKTQDTEKQDYTSQSMEYGTPKSRNARLCVTVPTELTGQSRPHLNTFTSICFT